MGTWGGTILSQTKLCGVKSGAGAIITTGNLKIGGVSYTGTATIDSQVTAVTDIDDPAGSGGWTDLVDLTGGPYVVTFTSAAYYAVLRIAVAAVEDSGDSLRLQVLKDGDVIWDAKAVGDNANAQSVYCNGTQYSTQLRPSVGNIYCETSFKIRVARKGGYTEVDSVITVQSMQYNEVEKL